ncbi:hypothetical protein BKA70DRAFT_1502829 [Coprinopsis sp. MPI-PUGE-AT-0042]|nr:hypothetical protein BKA70DRAFT_1502829 [Coprinopsis sp. MPI-PUGE-AT-0042]
MTCTSGKELVVWKASPLNGVEGMGGGFNESARGPTERLDRIGFSEPKFHRLTVELVAVETAPPAEFVDVLIGGRYLLAALVTTLFTDGSEQVDLVVPRCGPASFLACRPSISSNVPSLSYAFLVKMHSLDIPHGQGNVVLRQIDACISTFFLLQFHRLVLQDCLGLSQSNPSSATDFSKEALPRTTDASPPSRPPLSSQPPIVTICSAPQSSRLQSSPKTSLLSLPLSCKVLCSSPSLVAMEVAEEVVRRYDFHTAS